MTINQERDELAAEMRGFVETVQREKRAPTADETASMDGKLNRLRKLNAQVEESRKGAELLSQISSAAPAGAHMTVISSGVDAPAKSIGEHFAKHAGSRLVQMKGVSNATVSAPEFAKAATDVHLVGAAPQNSLTTIDTTVVRPFRPQPVVADLLSSGTMAGTALTYYVEAGREGNFTAVAEGGLKPQLHYSFDVVTDTLSKIAGRIKLSDEMIEDLPFLVSEINTRLLYDLSIAEEQALLLGSGTAPNLRGLLNRSGIQTETAAAGGGDNLDAIFRAMTKIQTATGFAPDGLVIHPLNYQQMRLARDANNQYYGGGPFTGAYGNGGLIENPAVWGLRTVVSSAIPVNTALVGAFAQAATVYRKGGVRVESTNSNVDDFEHNLVTIRAEERVGLAVRVPLAVCRVTLTAAA